MKKDLIEQLNLPEDVAILEIAMNKASEPSKPLDLTTDRVPDSVFDHMKEGIDFVREQIARGNDEATFHYGFRTHDGLSEYVRYKVCKRK
jgi:hypothetical protein